MCGSFNPDGTTGITLLRKTTGVYAFGERGKRVKERESKWKRKSDFQLFHVFTLFMWQRSQVEAIKCKCKLLCVTCVCISFQWRRGKRKRDGEGEGEGERECKESLHILFCILRLCVESYDASDTCYDAWHMLHPITRHCSLVAGASVEVAAAANYLLIWAVSFECCFRLTQSQCNNKSQLEKRERLMWRGEGKKESEREWKWASGSMLVSWGISEVRLLFVRDN